MFEFKMGLSVLVKTGLCTFMLLCFLPGGAGISCFYCNGITEYDPNKCWDPTVEGTIIQECAKGDWCEKKVSRIDSKHEQIERGCSSNCAGRSYVYTDSFDVHCCNEDRCNGETSLNSTSSHVTVLVVMVISALSTVFLLTQTSS